MLIHNLSDARAIINKFASMGQSYPLEVLARLAALLYESACHPKAEYQALFERDEDGGWYIVFPDWPGSRAELAMVCGADRMLDAIGHGAGFVRMAIRPAENPIPEDLLSAGWVELSLQRSSIEGGGTYLTRGIPNFTVRLPWSKEPVPRTVWLCPVTLFLLGGYPQYLYGKVLPD